MTDQPMRERLARALCRASFQDPDSPSRCDDLLVWQTRLREVDSLLTEMENPSDAVLSEMLDETEAKRLGLRSDDARHMLHGAVRAIREGR